MPVIYLDVLLVVNWVVDYLLLCSTACVLRIAKRSGRILLAGLFGAFSSCVLFLLSLPTFLIPIWNVVGASVLIFIAFSFDLFGSST